MGSIPTWPTSSTTGTSLGMGRLIWDQEAAGLTPAYPTRGRAKYADAVAGSPAPYTFIPSSSNGRTAASDAANGSSTLSLGAI